MEENLSLIELETILEAGRKREHNRNRFTASLKGIDLDEGVENESRFDAVNRRAHAKAAGMGAEEYELSDLGVGVDTE